MNVQHEVEVLRQMALDLPEYLLADVLFWPLAGAEFPKLSLGLMLLTRQRLAAASDQLNAGQQAERSQAEAKIDATLAQWRTAAEKKAGQELASRLKLWQNFWADCREEPKNCASNYPHEVTQRAIAALLVRAFPALVASASGQALSALDGAARARLSGDQFVWEPELQASFPRPAFWFLYGHP